MGSVLRMYSKRVLPFAYLQLLSICLKNDKCSTCFLYNTEYKLCELHSMDKSSHVRSVLEAKKYCDGGSCSKCPFILKNFNPELRCDFNIFLDKIGVISKW